MRMISRCEILNNRVIMSLVFFKTGDGVRRYSTLCDDDSCPMKGQESFFLGK